MFLILLLFLLSRPLAILGSFTLTDPEDFLPVISLGIGLICAVFIGTSKRKKAPSVLLSLLLLLSLWPILPNFGLYFMARELQTVHGSWPQVMVDDPKNLLGYVSPRFDAFFSLVNYLEAFSGAWMIIFVALLFTSKSRLSVSQRQFAFL